MFLIHDSYNHPVFGVIKSAKFPPSDEETIELAVEKIQSLGEFLERNELPLNERQITLMKTCCQRGLNPRNLTSALGEICCYILSPPQLEFLAQREIASWGTEKQEIDTFAHVLGLLNLYSIHLTEDEISSLKTFIKRLPPPKTSEELDRTYETILNHAKKLVVDDCTSIIDSEDYCLVSAADY